MRQLLPAAIGIASALAVVPIASAADLGPQPVYEAPPAFSWTGCYVGGNAGWTGDADGDLFTHPGPPRSYSGLVFNPSPNAHSYDGGSGFIGGGQIGCNYQVSQFVLGVEGDFDGTSVDWSDTASYPTIFQSGPNSTSWSAHRESVNSAIPWLATVRGRLGLAFDRWMVYATGGLAVAKVDARLDYNSPGLFRLIGSDSGTQAGWTAGGGAEWAFRQNWSLKAEYLYADLGDFSFLARNVVPGGGDSRTWAMDVDTQVHIARGGINYHF